MKHLKVTASLAALGIAAMLYGTTNSWQEPQTTPDQISSQVVTPVAVSRKAPSPLHISYKNGNCVTPSERELYVLKEGESAWTAAENTLRPEEDVIQRFIEITRLSNIRHYQAQKGEGADPTLLQIGERLISRNKGLAPLIDVPSTIVLEEGQEFRLDFGLEGLLCESEITVRNLPSGAQYRDNSFYWTPGFLQTGRYILSVKSSDLDARVDKNAMILVKGTDHEFVTDSKIKYRVLGTATGSAITIDNKTMYELFTNATVPSYMLPTRTDPEASFLHIHRARSGYDLSDSPHWKLVLDDVRRRIVTNNEPHLLTAYELKSTDKGWYTVHPFPILGEKIEIK